MCLVATDHRVVCRPWSLLLNLLQFPWSAVVGLHPFLVRTRPCLSHCPPQLPACLLSGSSLPWCSWTGGRPTSLQVLIPRSAILPTFYKPPSLRLKTKQRNYKLLFTHLKFFFSSCVLQEQATTWTRFI